MNHINQVSFPTFSDCYRITTESVKDCAYIISISASAASTFSHVKSQMSKGQKSKDKCQMPNIERQIAKCKKDKCKKWNQYIFKDLNRSCCIMIRVC